jgi:hypothetical protein
MADWEGGCAREDVELEARECTEEVLEALATGSEPKDAGALADLATGAVCSLSNISVIAMLAAASTDDAEDKARTGCISRWRRATERRRTCLFQECFEPIVN